MTLIGYWPLNEQTGTKAYDHSGNENHGTVNDGGDSVVPGANGILGQNAYSFDGNNDYVDIGSYFLDSSFTILLWVNYNVLYDYGVSFGSEKHFSFTSYGNGDVNAAIGDGSGWDTILSTGSGFASENRWYLLAATYDGSNFRFYVDGVQIDSSSSSISVPSTTYTVGSRYNSSYNHDGKISELRIYNRAITATEIQYLYNVSQRGSHTSSKKEL